MPPKKAAAKKAPAAKTSVKSSPKPKSQEAPVAAAPTDAAATKEEVSVAPAPDATPATPADATPATPADATPDSAGEGKPDDDAASAPVEEVKTLDAEMAKAKAEATANPVPGTSADHALAENSPRDTTSAPEVPALEASDSADAVAPESPPQLPDSVAETKPADPVSKSPSEEEVPASPESAAANTDEKILEVEPPAAAPDGTDAAEGDPSSQSNAAVSDVTSPDQTPSPADDTAAATRASPSEETVESVEPTAECESKPSPLGSERPKAESKRRVRASPSPTKKAASSPKTENVPLKKDTAKPKPRAVVRDSSDNKYVADGGSVSPSVASPTKARDGSPRPTTGSPRLQPPMRHAPPQDDRTPLPGPRNLQITVDPAAMQRTLEEKKQAQQMRRERRKREKAKLTAELAEAELRAAEASLARDRERQRREDELKDRLDVLREKKAQRELEFLVSEKRAQQVRASKSLADVIQEQYDAKQRAEEEERQRALQERREKMHAPVLSGLEAVQRHFSMVEERKQRKEQELRERKEAMERAAPEPYHGSSYEGAVEDFVRFKNGEADARHQRLYKHAKMQEYGNLVKRLYGPKAATPPPDFYGSQASSTGGHNHERNRSPPPFVTAPHGNATGVASPALRRESQDPSMRNKAGNQYLREVLATKLPPPPGLKVAPLEQPKDVGYERLKDRKKKGDQYLRQVRELPLKRSQSTPHPSRDDAAEAKALEVRRLKVQTASLENRLHGRAVDLEDPEACVQSNEEYLEMVRLKLELLRKAPTRGEPSKAGTR